MFSLSLGGVFPKPAIIFDGNLFGTTSNYPFKIIV